MPGEQTLPVRVAVTGAAGRIGYSLLFRIAAGEMLGPHQPITLQLLEIPQGMAALEGVAMELDDCAFDLLAGVEITDRAETAFAGATWAILVGSRPRTKGMERKDLLEANGAIFTGQGRALSEQASDDVRILVVGNPANTNCLIAMRNAADIPAERFNAMTRLDHNRAVAALARKTSAPASAVRRMTIWGNHSSTQYPDVFSAEIDGTPATELVDLTWLEGEFIPAVAQRGAAIIDALGVSSAASAASAAIDHVSDWNSGTPTGDWVSVALPSDGSYGVPTGLVNSFPCTSSHGRWEIVEGIALNDFSRPRLLATVAELAEEREAVTELGLLST